MKTLITMLIIVTTMHLDAQDVASDDYLLKTIASDSKSLKALLKDEWIVASSKSEITLTSRFEVFLIAYINPPRSPRYPEFSDQTPRDELLAHGAPKKYVIRLRYSKPLSPGDYEKKRAERQEAAYALEHGTRTIDEYDRAGKIMMNTLIPRYESGGYQITESLTDTPYAAIFPPASVKKVGAARAIIARYLHVIRTGTDPSTD